MTMQSRLPRWPDRESVLVDRMRDPAGPPGPASTDEARARRLGRTGSHA